MRAIIIWLTLTLVVCVLAFAYQAREHGLALGEPAKSAETRPAPAGTGTVQDPRAAREADGDHTDKPGESK
jgi:hypothetical protein